MKPEGVSAKLVNFGPCLKLVRRAKQCKDRYSTTVVIPFRFTPMGSCNGSKILASCYGSWRSLFGSTKFLTLSGLHVIKEQDKVRIVAWDFTYSKKANLFEKNSQN